MMHDENFPESLLSSTQMNPLHGHVSLLHREELKDLRVSEVIFFCRGLRGI